MVYTLRHNLSKFDLTLDKIGFTDIDKILQSISNQKKHYGFKIREH